MAGIDPSELDDDRIVRLNQGCIVDFQGHRLGENQVVDTDSACPPGFHNQLVRADRLSVRVEQGDRQVGVGLAGIEAVSSSRLVKSGSRPVLWNGILPPGMTHSLRPKLRHASHASNNILR